MHAQRQLRIGLAREADGHRERAQHEHPADPAGGGAPDEERAEHGGQRDGEEHEREHPGRRAVLAGRGHQPVEHEPGRDQRHGEGGEGGGRDPHPAIVSAPGGACLPCSH